jgi:hypothetical protein
MNWLEIFIFVLYGLPGLLAYFLRHPQRRWIALATILFSWTGIGWLVCLGAALNRDSFSFLEVLLRDSAKEDLSQDDPAEKLKQDLAELSQSRVIFVRESAEKGLAQLQRLEHFLQAIEQLLESKLNKGELTYVRQMKGAERAYEAALDQLRLMVGLLRNLDLDAGHNTAKGEQRELSSQADTQESSRQQEASVRAMLSRNDDALVLLGRLSASWAEIGIIDGRLPESLESALKELEHLVGLVERYQPAIEAGEGESENEFVRS